MKMASKDKFLLSCVMVFPPVLASQNYTIAELERWLTQWIRIHTALAEDLNADPNTHARAFTTSCNSGFNRSGDFYLAFEIT